jgi:uncharacterized protein YlxP (DUF503 family)
MPVPAVVGLLVLDLYIPDARTLKDKRRVIRSLVDRLKTRYGVSVAEVDQLDKRCQATIAVACVSNERAQVERVLSHVDNAISREHDTVVETSSIEVL